MGGFLVGFLNHQLRKLRKSFGVWWANKLASFHDAVVALVVSGCLYLFPILPYFLFSPVDQKLEEVGLLRWSMEQGFTNPTSKQNMCFCWDFLGRDMCVSLNGGNPPNTPKWSFLVGKPMVVGYQHCRKPPYVLKTMMQRCQTHETPSWCNDGASPVLKPGIEPDWRGHVGTCITRRTKKRSIRNPVCQRFVRLTSIEVER